MSVALIDCRQHGNQPVLSPARLAATASAGGILSWGETCPPVCSCRWLQARNGEADSTPDEILQMVKQLAAPPHRLAAPSAQLTYTCNPFAHQVGSAFFETAAFVTAWQMRPWHMLDAHCFTC